MPGRRGAQKPLCPAQTGTVDPAARLTHSRRMEFARRLTRSPRPHDRERGAEIAAAFAEQPPELRDLLAGAGGSSPYLHGLIQREADWLRQALAEGPETALGALLEGTATLDARDLRSGLRRAKGRLALLVALADLGGVWALEEVTGALTDFADLAVQRALSSLVAAEIDRGKLPGAGEADKADCAGMVVLAMGKMGARELNYSSDIDLICLFDESRHAPDDFAGARAAFIRITRRMSALLSEPTAEGYVFRTDLRLRPDPAVTPVCLSMEAAERYYESLGRTWERAAHVKARPCAGDLEAGRAYLERLSPFIWRKHLDFAAIQDAHDMRLRIREHKRLHGPIRLEGHNMKLGAGGIREIEFFTQTRQIIAGGRDPSLRVRGTLEGLARLAAGGWVPGEVAAHLSEDYRAHREIEHRLQMISDAQTHSLPRDEEGFARLAALSGREPAEMRADIARRLERVAQLTEGFFNPAGNGASSRPGQGAAPGDASGPDDLPADPMAALGEGAAGIIERWRTYPALRSQRSAEIFARLRPRLLGALARAARPPEALLHFDAFLSRLPAGVQVFSMFEANPQLMDLMSDIVTAAPRLAQYLGRNAQVFDAVIAGDFFSPWPGMHWLADALSALLEDAPDYEERLNTARRWQKEWHFRIGVHHLRGLIDAAEAGAQYAQLAEAVLRALAPLVERELARKHGPAPGNGYCVLGMGSLGAGRLGSSSDLDLIVIYDADNDAVSEGRRPLAARSWYARFTQALVTALGAPMAEGRLYEVDMRLRPSGRKGPVATSFTGFRTYQRNEAWTWEHLALTRARPVAGDERLGARVEEFRQALLARGCDRAGVLADVSEMRARLHEAHPRSGTLDVKNGPGGLQDIELLAQTAALLSGDAARDPAGQLASGARSGWLSEQAHRALLQAHDLQWRLRLSARLVADAGQELQDIGDGARDFILRETGFADPRGLGAALKEASGTAAGLIDALLEAPAEPRAVPEAGGRGGSA